MADPTTTTTAARPRRSTRSIERFDGFAAVRCLPKTGRTHQIRVHLASIGCPVLCDRLYGGQAQLTLGEVAHAAAEPGRVLLDRQALHAQRLRLTHPKSGEMLEFTAPPPRDLDEVLEALRQYRPLRRRAGPKTSDRGSNFRSASVKKR